MVSRGAVLVLLVALVASVYAGRETLKVRACDTPTATRVIAKQTILIGLVFVPGCCVWVCGTYDHQAPHLVLLDEPTTGRWWWRRHIGRANNTMALACLRF